MRERECYLCVCLCAHVLCVWQSFTSTLILTDTLIWMGNRAFYHQFVWVLGGKDGCVTFACVCVYVFVCQHTHVSPASHPLCLLFPPLPNNIHIFIPCCSPLNPNHFIYALKYILWLKTHFHLTSSLGDKTRHLLLLFQPRLFFSLLPLNYAWRYSSIVSDCLLTTNVELLIVSCKAWQSTISRLFITCGDKSLITPSHCSDLLFREEPLSWGNKLFLMTSLMTHIHKQVTHSSVWLILTLKQTAHSETNKYTYKLHIQRDF